ncbi:hypothetical protein QIH85_24000 [Bradyrhizobium japonicum]|uniref:hypothetical protein n=1 Tax=Bradyrhizobium japonicum TaxID=375 RepID=UPI0027150895|nr:hypothetical protein [Bradyrhizobium japonicum]WLB24947.1 hypothetical protein QIH85_24000 [Bradyrhizobium japonicum]
MIKQLARTMTEALRDEPLALSLVIVNTLFLLAGLYGLREIVQAVERKDALLTQLTERCLIAPRKEN